MRKEQISNNQLSMFQNTMHGEEPCRFHGKYIKTEKHQRHFRSQAKYMIDNFCNGEFWTRAEWILKTGFCDADRILRHINEGKFTGYGREEKKITEHCSKYRIIKLDN